MKFTAKHLAMLALSVIVALPALSWAGKDYSTVNSGVRVESNESAGDVESVNGSIRIGSDAVVRSIESVNGGIQLLSGTVVEGHVKVRKPRGWFSRRNKPVKVEIGEDVQVRGDLIFEQPVELRIHNSASVGEVIGDEITVVES